MEGALDPIEPNCRWVEETGWRQLVIVAAIMLAALFETLDWTIVNVALPTIEGNIGASIDQGIWIITGYIISNVVSIPLNPLLIRLFDGAATSQPASRASRSPRSCAARLTRLSHLCVFVYCKARSAAVS